MSRFRAIILAIVAVSLLAACRQQDTAVSPTIAPTAAPVATDAPAAAVEDQAEPEPTSADPAADVAAAPTDTPSPTATPLPPKDLVVCVAAEPTSLFLYGDNSLTAVSIRHGIYENLVNSLAYDYQPQGLAELPSADAGSVRLETVEVEENATVLDARGVVQRFTTGVTVRNAAGELVTFADQPVLMSHLIVDFTLAPMVWSDGQPVTADDSVFSFEIAANSVTPGSKTKIERTAVYTATGDLTVQWVGIPGFIDSTYVTNVWSPLPRHLYGRYSAIDLLALPEAQQSPLSSGPFVVADWTPGESIRLEKNPYYYRAADGLPHLDSVTFKVQTVMSDDLLASGECQIIAQDVIAPESVTAVLAASDAGQVQAQVVNSPFFEQIAFGIEPIEEYATTRPDWFGETQVRQAITMCIDRQRMVDELLNGRAEVLNTFVPADHPLYPADVTVWPYDPDEANALLDELGYIDTDGDGVREQPDTAVPFRFRLSTDAASPLRAQIVQMVQADLAGCGLTVDLDFRQPAEWYGDGPLGSLFGRRFDMGALAWRTAAQPPCGLWLSDNITGPLPEGYGGWTNINPNGWRDEAYDEVCRTASRSLPGTEAYTANHQEALRIFSRELPSIPLFTNLKVAATQPDVLNFQLDTTQTSELWNIGELDLGR
ncbi:MAG: ABC transporter substrate-binding protein [Candidatus Promineifilaceae bacterium]